MRIVIDLQGAQSTGSRNRGIGNYSLALAKAMLRNAGEHEILIALSDLFPDTVEPIRRGFDGLLPQENICIWTAPGPISYAQPTNNWRRRSAELVREAFLASLRPDVLHVSSLFEGFGDDAATSIRKKPDGLITAVTLYDLIPFIYPDPYRESHAFNNWYLEKIEHLCKADLWLAISGSSRREGLQHLDLAEDRCANISTDASPQFRRVSLSERRRQELRAKYAFHRPFIMYTGGVDHRKNIEGLIGAFARLPASLRKQYQLAIVCSVRPEDRLRLESLAQNAGLGAGDLVLTGFVPEDELVALYNLCALFVFPSWHEGFGLPALEAMRCGAAVIGSNTSSIPEVIGLKEALFDPHSEESISQTMERGLTDDGYRRRLLENGRSQAKKFSWDESAKRAIDAMERLHKERTSRRAFSSKAQKRLRLAYVSPLPPERSGIADYSAELLPALAEHYSIDVITAQKEVSDTWIVDNCQVRDSDWFLENAKTYDRVLYHFGNSVFHQHMFELLKKVPGVVVLHDFFLSGIAAHMEVHQVLPDYWTRELYTAHGYDALNDRMTAKDAGDVVWKYPSNLSVIQNSLGIIVHSQFSANLAAQWYHGRLDWAIIPLLRNPCLAESRIDARKVLSISPSDVLVCAFGMIGPTKQSKRLLDAWLKSSLSEDSSCHLVFVGENHSGEYGDAFLAAIRRSKARKRVRITGWTPTSTYRQYLASADVAVQLRTLTRGETSAALLDCLNHGIATIVNANGSMADLDDDAVCKLPDDFSDEGLVETLEELRANEERRRRMGIAAREMILQTHNPRSCAAQYRSAVERFYRQVELGWRGLPSAIADLNDDPGEDNLVELAENIAKTFPSKPRRKQLLVDVSELIQRDVGTGIQRVVRNVLRELLLLPPEGYRVEPVYATETRGYYYARRFTLDLLEISNDFLVDDPIEFASGDILFALDLCPSVVRAHRAFFQELRRYGVQVFFAVYDLLCIRLPQHFVPGAYAYFASWLEVVAENDGAVCISEAVAGDLRNWMQENAPDCLKHYDIKSVHLGANIDRSRRSTGLPPDARDVFERVAARPTFLMVGTIEPRKGYAQALPAFESLWAAGLDVNLVIVGTQGWNVEALVEKLRSHPERGKRLFWLEGISDEYLEKIYAASTCLVAASEGEGFGLPLIEAARHKIPILARDIPVFREVTGDHAAYFSGLEPADLADAVRNWLALFREGRHPRSDDMPWITWKESARQMMDALLGGRETSTTPDAEDVARQRSIMATGA